MVGGGPRRKGPTGALTLTAALLLALQALPACGAASRGIRRSVIQQQARPQSLTRHAEEQAAPPTPRIPVPEVTHSGYVDVSKSEGSAMFYMYYEARNGDENSPIVLWLQGGPGCSSLFGMLYINGPYWINDDLTLRPNPGSWGRLYGLLFIEQPISVGFSRGGTQRIPHNEVEVAEDLYTAINNWYTMYPQYQHRPLIVTGESYAGKYVPSFSHYILQADAQTHGYIDKLDHPRPIGKVNPPVFKLGGMAIGNGWTDADTQQMVQGDVAWSMGLIDLTTKRQIDILNQAVLDQVLNRNWRAARAISDQVNDIVANFSSTYTLEDVRRNLEYDGHASVDQFLNQAHVKRHIGADKDTYWVSCSPEVDQIMGPDVMKSVKKLGQWDAECGVASNDAWIQTMKWPGHLGFNTKRRQHWQVNGRTMGYWRHHMNLTQLVIRNTGHMVPHDNPYYGQLLLERWIEEAVRQRTYNRATSEAEEEEYLRVRGSDEGQWSGPP